MNQYQQLWEFKSSVRSRPRKPIDFQQTGYFFPPDKQVLLLLPEIAVLGEQVKKNILLLTLRKYLNDIVKLEIHSIHRACVNIINNQIIPYSQEMRLNAYTIILDEYYHAYNAADILSQLDEMYSTLPQFEYICSDSEHALTTIKNKLPDKHREIFEIIAVSIFETTLIREVVTTFQNESLHPSIRSYARDHMNDESRHYHFFYEILNYTWQHMSNESIEAIGPYIGEFLKLYLNIDQEKLFNFQIINWVLGNKIKCQQLINELYQGFAISEQIPIVNNVINVLKRTELFKHKAVQEGFKLAQLNFDLLTSPTKLLAE